MSVSRFVGLDLGTSGIRAVEARWHRDHYQIKRAAEVDLPEGCLLNGVILDADSVVKALRHLWRKGRFSTRKVAFAVTDTSVITRQLELPWMPADDFRTALKYQVGDALPVDLATVEVDFEPIAEFQVTDQHGQVNDMLQFLLVAANKEVLSGVSEVLLRARLEPIVADTSAFALIRAACGGVLAQDRPLEAIVDIGADALTVVIHQGGLPRFIRAMPNQGGDIVIMSVASTMDLTIDEATDLVWRTGLNGPPPVVTPVPESSVFGLLASTQEVTVDPQVKRAMAVINPWATTLVGAIRDSLDYFASTGQQEQVARMSLAGRTAHLPGLAERVTTELRVPIDFLDPFASARATGRLSGINTRALSVATGLSMGA